LLPLVLFVVPPVVSPHCQAGKGRNDSSIATQAKAAVELCVPTILLSILWCRQQP